MVFPLMVVSQARKFFAFVDETSSNPRQERNSCRPTIAAASGCIERGQAPRDQVHIDELQFA